MKNKTISFCITCYDLDYHLLDGILEALKLQTEAPDEVIISSSGIDPKDLLNKYIVIAGLKVPIISVNSVERYSEGEARNAGGKASKCNIVQFFDVDDHVHEQRVEFVKKAFDITNCDALVCSYKTGVHSGFDKLVFNPDLLFECYWGPDDGDAKGQLRANPDCNIAHGPIAIDPEVLETISYTTDVRAADCKFGNKLISNKKKVFYYHEELMHYNL